MGVLRILSERGDDQVEWNPCGIDAGDLEAQAAVAEAERIFAAQRAQGATAYRVAVGVPPVRVDQFDVAAEQIIIIPPVVGG